MQFDYIIVGAGSAGCVLANRLSGDSNKTVLLLEAGPENKALSLKIPAAVLSNLNSTKYNWAFQSEPEPHLNGRTLKHDRGKTLGGSSSINGMVMIRGHVMHWILKDGDKPVVKVGVMQMYYRISNAWKTTPAVRMSTVGWVGRCRFFDPSPMIQSHWHSSKRADKPATPTRKIFVDIARKDSVCSIVVFTRVGAGVQLMVY